jgi:glycosyltransferase involved in cell wall biosynthesis
MGIGTLLSDFENLRWMGRNGRYTVEAAFSWDSIANKMLGVYQS